MRVICRRIISQTTGEDMGSSSPWLKLDKEYVVLALSCGENIGIHIYIQTENFNDPYFVGIQGFEFVNQHIPSSWITVASESYGRKVLTMLPASWNYDDFFEDMNDQKPEAIKLFNKEAELIYREDSLKN